MSDNNLVARIGQIATKGKHKERFLFVGTIEPVNSQDKFFYLIEIDTPWVDGEKIKNTIVNTLSEGWRATGEKLEAFETKIKKINAALGDLSQAGEHEWIGKLNSIIGIISGEQLIFSQTGRISGYLFRGNKISHITEKPLEEDEIHPLKTFVSIIDGSVAALDKVIIANSELYSHFSLDRLRHIFTELNYKDGIEEIVKNLRRSKIKDANMIVFELLNSEASEADETDKPNIILLDDIPDSKALHYTKTVFKGLGSGAKATGKGAKKFAEFWQRSVAPKISEKAKNICSSTKKISSGTLKPSTEKFDRVPKVNYFNKKTSKGSGYSTTNQIFVNLLLFLKSLLKVENRKYLYIVIIVVLLGVGFIKIQLNNKDNGSLTSANANLESLDSARSLYAKALDSLGLKKTGAKEELISSRDAAIKATSSPPIADEANNLLAQINAKLDALNSATRIRQADPQNFDLSDKSIKTIAVGANLFVISQSGDISKYDTRSKTSEAYGKVAESFGKVVNATYSESSNSILILTDKSAVVKLNIDNKSLTEAKIAEGQTWEASVAIATYANNIYLLDSINGQIWKHTAGDSEYSKGTAYVVKQPISLKDSKDLTIDGNLFVLKDDGKTVKITKGVEDSSFNLSAIPTPDDKILGASGALSTSDTNSIYILDTGANRLLQFSKTGAFQKQYVFDGMPMTSFAVNEKLKKLWLISETKVFEKDL